MKGMSKCRQRMSDNTSERIRSCTKQDMTHSEFFRRFHIHTRAGDGDKNSDLFSHLAGLDGFATRCGTGVDAAVLEVSIVDPLCFFCSMDME